MNLFDLYEGREPYQQAIDKLEQARIDHLKEKMDYYAKHGMAKEFMKAKAEHDGYHKLNVDEAGIGHDIANKQEKMARATPSTPAGKVASTVKNAAKWLAGQGGPGREGPTYEGQDQKKNSEEVEEGFQDFNKVEPYEVCLAGKCVKTFDYYEDARRFHDNWKKKLYREGDKVKADKITLNPVMKEQGVAEGETDFSKRRQRERNIDAGRPVARQRQPKQTDYQKRRAQDKKDMELGEVKTRLDPKCWTGKKIGNPKIKVKGGVRVNNCVPAKEDIYMEDNETRDAVESAIVRRILVAHTDLLMKYGPEKTMEAAAAIADEHSDVEEIGTSDVSAYVQQVERYLAMNY